MKRKTIIVMLGLSLFLAGCQSNEENSSMSSNSSTNGNAANNSGETMELEETRYGRDAQSDGADTNANGEPTRILTEDASSIIVYFSRSGNSENLARIIYNETGSDILELSIAEPYPADYEATVERADEERENQDFPEISTEMPDFSQYDTVYLGYQTWSMTLSNPITSFLIDNGSEFSGKTIFPFSTNRVTVKEVL